MAIQKEKIIDIAKSVCPELNVYEHRDQLSLVVPAGKLSELALALKESDETKFDMLVDITAIDWLKREERYEVVYFLYSNQNKSRVRIKVPLKEDSAVCPSLVPIWESANWYERETFDMYGIKFDGHPSLRRFYMPEDFADPATGESLHPLRKDFPLMGLDGTLPLPPFPERDGEPD